MLLAEGLALRADLQKRLEALTSRIAENARVPRDEDPDEDPNALVGKGTGFEPIADRPLFI